jgi:hypothetical protein
VNLATHARLIWRFKAVSIVGLLLSITLAFLATFDVPSMQRRGTEKYQSISSLFVTQEGFPWGRVTLPGVVTDASGKSSSTQLDGGNGIQFADPGRFSNLARLYSILSISDLVRRDLPGHPTQDQISTRVLDTSGNGSGVLPIIAITTFAGTAKGAQDLNSAVVRALSKLLTDKQQAAGIAGKDRVQLSLIDKPSPPTLFQGRSKLPALLALMLGVLGTLAVLHLLAAIREKGRGTAPGGTAAAQAAPLGVVETDDALPGEGDRVPAGIWLR